MRTPITLTIAVVSAAFIAGCSNSNTNSTGDLRSTSGTSSAAAATTEPKQKASEQSLAMVDRYFQTLSKLDADPATPIAAVEEVATGDALTYTKADVTVRRSQGVAITGSLTVSKAKVTDIRLEPASATSVVRVCVDSSTRDAKNPDGSSAIGADRLTKSATTLTLQNVQWPDGSGWRVVGDSALQQRKQEPCDG